VQPLLLVLLPMLLLLVVLLKQSKAEEEVQSIQRVSAAAVHELAGCPFVPLTAAASLTSAKACVRGVEARGGPRMCVDASAHARGGWRQVCGTQARDLHFAPVHSLVARIASALRSPSYQSDDPPTGRPRLHHRRVERTARSTHSTCTLMQREVCAA
jgi:hypothetical protein